MSTNARIGMCTSPGRVVSIYTHWDGYVEHNGRILVEHYTEPEKVRALLALGSLSILSDELGEKHDFDKHLEEHPDWCLAYGRDREETDVSAKEHDSDDWPDSGQSFEYVFKFDHWVYRKTYPEKGPWLRLDVEAVLEALRAEKLHLGSLGYDTERLDAEIARLSTPTPA